MTVITEAALRELRLKYNAAYAAYQSCVMALNEAVFGGKKPTAELLASESAALGQLTDARTHLLRALAGLTNDYPSD